MMYGRGSFGNFDNYRNIGPNGCNGYGYMNHGWPMMIIAIVLIILATAVIIMLVRKNKKVTTKSSAIETLKMKYVQGDITEEEYLKRKDVLEKDN